MIDVKFSVTLEDALEFDVPMAKDHTILLGDWADCDDNAYGVCKDICESLFDTDFWIDQFGPDDDGACVLVRITEPPSIAGDYMVTLDRKVVASGATKL